MLKFTVVVLSGLFFVALLVDPALALQHLPLPPVPVPEPSLAERIGSIIGVSGATLVMVLLIARQLSEIIAKLIPDTATGIAGFLRKVAKVISGYVPNKA